MDPPPPFDHPHHRRGHHYTDQHHHFAGGSGAGGWGAVPVRSRYEYDSYEPLPSPYHHLPSDHHHHQPPPPAPPPLPPLHRHDAPHYSLPFRAPSDAYSSPPYQNPAPHHHHHHNHQRHCDDDFLPVDEIRRVANHHHHHHPQQQQLPWEETEDERRRYNAAHQLQLSPSGSRKRQRCAMHDCGDVESTSSSGPPPRRSRQQPHPNYAPDDNFVDRTSAHPGYIGHEGFSMHTDSKGNRKMQMPSQMALPGSPHAMGAGYPRCTTQKSAPTRLSVWQRIEENPAVYVPSSPPQMPKEVHVSPCKNNAGSASKELASVISVDCKGKSASGNDVDSNAGTKKNAGKNEKVLASILVKPSPESKEKEGSVKKVARKPDRVQKNVVGSTSKSVGSTACPGAGAKKVKKVIIKKIVRKIGGKDKQISRSIISEKRYSIDGNANACETEEGEITASSFEKDVVYAHNLVSSSDTTGAGNGVDVQKEENNNLTNPSKMNAASVIESTKILFPTSVSGSQHPGKEEARSSMDPGDNNAASAIESTRVLDTSGNEHPGKEEDKISMDSGVRNATFVSDNDYSQKQKEGKILALSGEMNVAIASNSVRISDGCEDSSMEESKVAKDVSENNAVYMDRVKVNHDATEVSGSEDARREDSKILIGTNEEGVIVNNFIGGPSTTEVTVSVGEGAQKKDGIIPIGSGKKSIASLGDSVGTPRTTEEVGVSQDAWEEEGNMLTHPSEKDFVSVGSWGTLNTVEVSVNEVIQEKEGRMPTEPSEANTSVIHHAKASNTTELSVDEHTQERESQMPIESCETNSFEIIHHLEAPNTTEVTMSKFVGSEVGKSLVGSNERHAGTTDNSANTPEFDEAGGTENNCMEDLLLNDRTALNERDAPLEVEDTYIFNPPSSRNVDSTNVLPLDDGPVDDSTSDIILNYGVGRNATSKAEELMHLHRAYLSPENDFTLVPSRESSSVSGNSEQSVPTALTLGSNIYFSRAESEGQPEENHELVEGHQGLDVATVTEFGRLGKRKGVAGDDLISADVQNWLILPPAVNNIAMSGQILNDDATVRKDRLGLDQIVDDDTFVSQDHDVTQDMDQRGCVHAFFSQDLSVRLCGSDIPQSDLLAPKESSRDVENQSGIALSGLHPISSINVLDRNNYQMVDVPVDNPNGPVLSAVESTDVMDAELVSSEVSVDPDHTYHSNTEDPGVESSTKQDLLSSWIETIVSNAKKENQPCKSTLPSLSSPDKLLAPKEDSRRAVFDPVVKSPQMNFTSSMLPKVAPKQVNLPSSSREPPHLSQNARHRTWHRGNMASSTSSLHALHPSGLPPKLPPKKNGKTQNSYIRKGNALIRNPATGNHPHSSSSMDTKNKLNKPVMRRSMNFVRKVDSNDFVVHSNISVERPKTPPLPLHNKSISCATNVPEQLSQTLQKQHIPETEKEDSIGQLNSGADNPSIKNAQQSEPSDASKVVYARPKSNKLVAAQRQHPGDSINSSMDKVLSLQPPTTSDLYFKKRKNQIILSSSPSDGQNTKDMTPTDSLNSGENKGLMIASSKNSITGVRDRAHKALQTTNNVGSFSHVWTLSGKQPQRKGLVGASHMKAFPRILPWKRKIYYKDFRRSHTSLLNTSSLRIVRKLLQTRNRDMIYTVSTDGFSLRKSGVLRVCGSSLKWSRSLEKHSQKVNEEATLAVAEVERKKREKRKRQSLRDKGRNDQYSVCVAGNQLRHNNQASSDLRRSSTCNEYVRVNKGNQLVRNPKKVIRMLASEKVRWSLHTVRSRLAKKQQYCQFFTRFGECKKPGGKCPYVHDRAKVTICTKFLKGLCSNTSCKLTHKVLPERMPDCSYFLRGLCTNTACPYRHVKVNSNAPVCEDFLKGYCADGDECHKKHSYVCPVFEVTGECPQQSRCKLHHPKKKIKSKSSRPDILQNSSWGRYFDTSIGHDSGTIKVSTDEEERQELQHVFSGGGFVDFIRLDADADEDVADVDATENIELMELDSGNFNAQADNLDSLIKPLRIMRTARV